VSDSTVVPQRKEELHQSASWLLAVLIVSVFLIEMLIMLFLPLLHQVSGLAETLLDATTLSLLLFPIFYFLVFRPLTRSIAERRQTEARLQLAASVFTHASEGIMIADAAANIIEVNDTFSAITGYSRDEVLGQNPRLLKSGRQGPEFYRAMWQALLENGNWQGEVWNRRKDGELYAAMVNIAVVRDDNGRTQNYVALFTDVTPMKARQEQIEYLAHYDVLTGLPNRVLFADRLQHAMAQNQRRGRSLALAYLDLDGFKTVNDNHGHEVGDNLLVAVTGRMKAALREGDTLARIGGDEFVAMIDDLDDSFDLEPVLVRLLKAVADPVNLNGVVLNVSASIGVTLYPQDEADADTLLRHADQAMYVAKQAGKNRYCLFDAGEGRNPASRPAGTALVSEPDGQDVAGISRSGMD
jgi:diguanylate cyclase (GGDEF)-like protein/PAS domain S-box-containing protein